MQIQQQHKHIAFKATTKEDGTFAGYASVFNVKDSYGDVVLKGAFTKSLVDFKANGTMPRFLWQHRQDTPIGVFTNIVEDEKGLYIEGQLALKTAKGSEAYELLKMGAMDGLSIGYNTVKREFNQEQQAYNLIEIKLWEVSLVTFPANPATLVDSIKNELPQTRRAFEQFLRDAGYSHKKSREIASHGFVAETSDDILCDEEKAAVNNLLTTMKV